MKVRDKNQRGPTTPKVNQIVMNMRKPLVISIAASAASLALLWLVSEHISQAAPGQGDDGDEATAQNPPADQQVEVGALTKLREGRRVFRSDTFGDQAFWGDALKLHQAIAGAALGGVGAGVSPSTALRVGLKVDSDALPQALKQRLASGQVDLNVPASTLALLELNAVVGVTGFFDQQHRLNSIGIQCALCHSTVDNSFAPGIGHRLDGWPNRDLNVGAIINLAPNLSPFTNALQVDEATVRTVLLSWGPGKFDAALLLDGKAFRPDGKSAATVLPAAFGLGGVNLHTYTGWGSVPYWNAFVANLEMQGSGRFSTRASTTPIRSPWPPGLASPMSGARTI